MICSDFCLWLQSFICYKTFFLAGQGHVSGSHRWNDSEHFAMRAIPIIVSGSLCLLTLFAIVDHHCWSTIIDHWITTKQPLTNSFCFFGIWKLALVSQRWRSPELGGDQSWIAETDWSALNALPMLAVSQRLLVSLAWSTWCFVIPRLWESNQDPRALWQFISNHFQASWIRVKPWHQAWCMVTFGWIYKRNEW